MRAATRMCPECAAYLCQILDAYPYLEAEDVQQAVRYAAWLADERIYAVEPIAA